MREYTWKISQESQSELVYEWEKELQIHHKLALLLQVRGFTSIQQAKEFFKPRTSQLHSPYLMADMEKAVSRLHQAIELNQKILVYGDYDVDGTTAVAMVYSFLKSLNCNVFFYVPDRYAEGYGVSMQGMQYAVDQKFDLIITLDCGIKANTTIEYAIKQGIDVIVCDHHEPGNQLPKAFAVLDPKRKDCKYPFKELSGCGVGFKLLHALCEFRDMDLKENLYCYLDILAVSIASDIVPIVDENRVYMYYGLLKMKSKPRIGIKAMMETSGMFGDVTVSDIVFKISPRINAAGRIYNARTSIELLISEQMEEAFEICETINKYNSERQEKDKKITQDALRLLERDTQTATKKTNVLFQKDWHKGVIGIVASRILEHYYKPTIIFCGEGDVISASARSVAEYDMYAALEQCSDLLVNFGGHKYAAGMSLKKESFQEFADKFESIVSSTILLEQLQPKILIDLELDPSDISIPFYEQVQKFAPFGPQNMTPVFIIKNLVDSGGSRVVGKNDASHIKLSLCQTQNPQLIIEGIGFGLAEKWKHITATSSTLDVCFVLRENVFRNERTIQLEIRDIRPSI